MKLVTNNAMRLPNLTVKQDPSFYDKSMKFGTVIPWTILISFGKGGGGGYLAHAQEIFWLIC